ncbi:hypothetical protein BKA69DRAFT_459343 [Paraphysoderma sedebokerense]|nr:hypothetical protein BKA69DRAFT_459343 [Paraphysoderma sedebokerense]
MTETVSEQQKKGNHTVIVTGFGPFGIHKVNPSWVAVSHLSSNYTPPCIPESSTSASSSPSSSPSKTSNNPITLLTHPLKVSYPTVTNAVPTLWNSHKPSFMLHVGVGAPGQVKIEKYGRNSTYLKEDVDGVIWKDENGTGKVKDDGEEVLETSLDADELVGWLRKKGWKSSRSEDAGRYLCDFTYYSSLYHCSRHRSKNSTLFLHVPPVGQPYSQEQIDKIVADVVKYICERFVLEYGMDEL